MKVKSPSTVFPAVCLAKHITEFRLGIMQTLESNDFTTFLAVFVIVVCWFVGLFFNMKSSIVLSRDIKNCAGWRLA